MFSLGRCPLQSQRAGERCLTSTQRPKAPGESRPPPPPWLTTALQRGASRPAVAAVGGTSPQSRRWHSGEPTPPPPPQPCANQVSPTWHLRSGSGYFLERDTFHWILRIQGLGHFPHFICILTYLPRLVHGHRGGLNRSPVSLSKKKKKLVTRMRATACVPDTGCSTRATAAPSGLPSHTASARCSLRKHTVVPETYSTSQRWSTSCLACVLSTQFHLRCSRLTLLLFLFFFFFFVRKGNKNRVTLSSHCLEV